MKATKILLIGAAAALGSGTAIVQAQTQAPTANPANLSAQAPADPLAPTPATSAAKAASAEAVPSSSAGTTVADKSTDASSETPAPVAKNKSKRKAH